MPKVRVSISGLGKDFIRIQASTIQALAEKQVEEIARETEIVIRQKIRERIEREGSTDNLATSFFAVPIVNGWGVGDIDYLNTHAKYWYWQNFGQAQTGRTIPPSTAEFPRNRGSFAGSPPESGGGNQGRHDASWRDL